jgi:hypothetical protein
MYAQGGQCLEEGGRTAAADLAVPVKADRVRPQGGGGQGQEQRCAGVPHINKDRAPGKRMFCATPYFPADKALPRGVRGIGTQGVYGAVFDDCGAQGAAGGGAGTGIKGVQGIIDPRNSLPQGGDKEPPDRMGLGRGDTHRTGKTVRPDSGNHVPTLAEETPGRKAAAIFGSNFTFTKFSDGKDAYKIIRGPVRGKTRGPSPLFFHFLLSRNWTLCYIFLAYFLPLKKLKIA